MRRFSIGRSIGDGFGLVTRRPLSVFVWGLLLLAPAFGSFALILPIMGEMFATMPAAGADAAGDNPFADEMFAEMMQFQLASMLLNIVQLVIMAVVYTAIFRAVLRPGQRGVFSLRLGMDELRVAVVGLAIGVVLYVATIVMVLLGGAIGFAFWGGDPVAAGWTLGVYALLALLGACWAMARASMMAPASVLYRDFAFVQGWRLASGKGWPLFGMMLLILLMIIAIEVVLVLIGVLAFSGFWAANGLDWTANQDANPFAGMNVWLTANWYWMLLGAAVGSFLYGVLLTLAVAPFASACRQLADGDAPANVPDVAGSPAPAQ
jgi:hypothetical protein